MDRSRGCVNFRDVGECVNLIAGRDELPTQRILRGGKLDLVESAEEIGNPGTIINLRMGPDPAGKLFGADHWHLAVSNDHERYDTTDPEVRRWLHRVVGCLADSVCRFPVFFHCTSGKDRTGVVVAALLAILGIDRELIVEEYLWSEGKVARAWIERALDGIGGPALYFRRVRLERVRDKLLGAR